MTEHETHGETRARVGSQDAYTEHVESIKQHVQTATESVERVIETEEMLREDPKRRDRAESRIIQAEREHGILEAEANAVEAGDLGAVRDLHEEYMRPEADEARGSE